MFEWATDGGRNFENRGLTGGLGKINLTPFSFSNSRFHSISRHHGVMIRNEDPKCIAGEPLPLSQLPYSRDTPLMYLTAPVYMNALCRKPKDPETDNISIAAILVGDSHAPLPKARILPELRHPSRR